MIIRTAIVRRPIDVAALMTELCDTANGATIAFVGTVREMNDGRAITGIEYSAYGEMAERELAAIASECSASFGIEYLVAEHRLGALALGDASIAIVAAHAHRGFALDALRYAIDEIKQRVPIWKREVFADGSESWVDPTRVTAT